MEEREREKTLALPPLTRLSRVGQRYVISKIVLMDFGLRSTYLKGKTKELHTVKKEGLSDQQFTYLTFKTSNVLQVKMHPQTNKEGSIIKTEKG